MTKPPVTGDAGLDWALGLFPEDDPRHWELRAFLFGRLQFRALQHAERLAGRRTNPSATSSQAGR